VASVPPAAEPEFSSSLDEPQLEDVTPPESANPVASEVLAELPDETPFQEPPAEITEFSDQLAENVPAEARTTPTTPEAVAPTEVSEAASDLEPAAPAGELPVEVTEELPAEAPVQAFSEPVEEPSQPYRAALPDPFQPLPESLEVRSGDTLWSLSGAYAEAQATSVNQVMLAVQQKNPNAFVEGNINALKAGEILRMPSRDEVLAQDAREAMLEVLRQEALYRTRWDLPPSPDALPTLSNLADAAPGTSMSTEADLGTDEEALAERTSQPAPVELEVAEEESVEEDSRLFLVPPSEDESQETQGMGQGGSGETGVSTGESVVEELARAREELANAQQEKAYLEDRLAELEAELARREVEEEAGLADTNLAEMEDRLRDDRLAGDEEPELAMPAEEDSWLSSFGPALAGLAVLAVVALVWFLRSRRDPEFTAGMEVPATGKKESAGDDGNDPAKSDKVESDDPEKLLDLARAYMAMGKRTQARDCIEAVTRLGTPAQVREARTMLAEL
jgi:FimV-like protein